MKLVYIETNKLYLNTRFTYGKSYLITGEDYHYRKWKMTNDNGEDDWPWKSQFITQEEFRETQLNILGI
jgi:hypothetical protein